MNKRNSIRALAIALLCVPLWFNPTFNLLHAEDSAAALGEMESKISADPDNLRLGSEYRQMAVRLAAYDRAIAFFEKVVAAHSDKPNAQLNFGFAYVDKVPAAGSITQVLLANNALNAFSKSIEVKPSWIALYTRGNSYLFWPKIFGRASNAVADIEAAMKMQNGAAQPYYVRTWIALGDGFWKMDELEKAKQAWRDGLKHFPDSAALKTRLAKDGDELKAVMDDTYDITRRVDTSLKEMFASEVAGK